MGGWVAPPSESANLGVVSPEGTKVFQALKGRKTFYGNYVSRILKTVQN
jgi:hypothetical protein